jgi:hypothetical protein
MFRADRIAIMGKTYDSSEKFMGEFWLR